MLQWHFMKAGERQQHTCPESQPCPPCFTTFGSRPSCVYLATFWVVESWNLQAWKLANTTQSLTLLCKNQATLVFKRLFHDAAPLKGSLGPTKELVSTIIVKQVCTTLEVAHNCMKVS